MRLIRLVPRLVPLAVLFALAPACGGSDTGSFEEGDGIPIEELPAKYADALCQAYESCFGDLLQIFRPGEDCVKNTTVTLEEGLATLGNSIDQKRVVYRGNKLQACLDEVSAGDCSTLSNRAPESCKLALEGTIAQGDDCTLDAECEGDQYCKFGDTCPGTCAPLEVAGGDCTGDSDCVSGLKCGPSLHCVAPSLKGEACKQGEPECSDGFVCLGDNGDTKTPGKCIAIAEALNGKAGDTCQLDSNLCDADFSCEITSLAPLAGECVSKVASGAACHVAIPDECPDSEYCALNMLMPLQPGTCTPKPKATETCAPGLGGAEICAPETRCDNGKCRPLAHAGEECTVDGTCYSGHCDGACVTSDSCQ